MSNLIAMHTDQSYEDRDGFWVVAAEEGVSGYSRINVWPTLAEAQQYAAEANARIGVSDDDRRRILASSMSR